MRTIARFMDARNTTEGKFLSVLLSVLLVFSFLNVTMFTDYANATDENAPEATRSSSSSPPPSPGTRCSPRTRPASSRRRRSLRRRARRTRAPPLRCSPSLAIPRRR